MKITRRALCWWSVGIPIAIGAAAWLSWLTTGYRGCGTVPQGHWKCRVVTSGGKPIPHARMTVEALRGEPYDCHFENTRKDGALIADEDGLIDLIVPKDIVLGFGIRGWDLFWLFPIEEGNGPFNDVLRFSADGYDSTTVPLNTVMDSRDTFVVRLKPKADRP